IGTLAQLELAELQAERIKHQQPADQAVAPAQDELYGLESLDSSHDARQYAQHPTLSAAWHQSGRRRLGIEATIARSFPGVKDRGLPFEAEDAGIDVGFAQQDTSVIHQVARGEVIGSVGHHVIFLEKVERVLGTEAGLVSHDFNIRIDIGDRFGGGGKFGASHILGAMDHLPLQVGEVHYIKVHQAELAHAGGGQVQGQGRPEPSGSDAKHLRLLQLQLALYPDFRHDQVPAVAQDLVIAELSDGG